ncbi:MAG TPA: site-2 protease family protein [bacterium]|jgi:Zn-dependent protease|nr:site-2 protease family protein [bacterium]
MLGLNPAILPYLAVALVVAATVHEFAHAYVADRLGDPTPRAMGRLTLNPLAHLDPIGSIMILLAGFGWAKPVQINPAYFTDWRRDSILVAVAGPLANVTLVFLLGLPFKLDLVEPGVVRNLLGMVIQINAMLAVFNLIPIPPLDGSKVVVGLLPPQLAIAYARVEPFGFLILLALIFTRTLSAIIVPPMVWLINVATGALDLGFFF